MSKQEADRGGLDEGYEAPGPIPAEDTQTEQPGLSDTEARRIRGKREFEAEFNAVLAKMRCPHCGTVGCWAATSSPKPEQEKGNNRIRYVKCKGCGTSSKVVLKDD